ncbi:MAG: methionine synthase [Candidatus Goldiibacteriota bacterium]
MNKRVHYLNFESPEPDKNAVLARLSYRKGITQMTPEQEKFLEDGIKKTASFCEVKTAYIRLKAEDAGSDFITAEGGIVFNSKKLLKTTGNTDELILMASTAGPKAVTARDEAMKNSPALGVIIDAAASETADAGLDELQVFIDKLLAKEGKKTTKRFSPGYGDLKIEAQKKIFEVLKLENIGISITETFMLEPEKSVLALCGAVNIRQENE